MRLSRQLCIGAGLLFVIAGTLLAGPRQVTAASGYQYPCNPYSVGGYNFGQFVSGWGYHAGQDVSCRAGTPVYAVADGVVTYSARTPDSYRWGNLILIQHNNSDGSQIVSLYGHLSADRRVAAGQSVGKGQLIGFIGPAFTGDNGNWADHLHFGMHPGPYGASAGTYASWVRGYESAGGLGAWVNPADYIAGHGGTPVTPGPPNPVNDYAIDSINYPNGSSTAKTGQYYIDFNLRNTGNTTWRINGANPMRLGTSRPMDRGSGFSLGSGGAGWASANRIALMQDAAPGQIGTFRALFTNTHVQPGRYIEWFQPVIEGQSWLPDRGIGVTLDVAPPRNTAQWVGQGVYTALNPSNTAGAVDSTYLVPGQKLNLKAYLRNTGEFTWQVGGPNQTRLGTSRPLDRPSPFATGGDGSIPISENWPNYNRPSSIDGRLDGSTVTPVSAINPGETAVFSFTITVPSQPGDYVEYFNPVTEGSGWLNDLGMWFRLRVLPAGYHFEYINQSNPGPLAYGDRGGQASIRIRNLGQSAWPVGGNVRLGTDRGRDRISSFQAGDWLTGTRASAIDANLTNPGQPNVGPGEIAEFRFGIDNPQTPDGGYLEYLRPVVDGLDWMADYGIAIPVTVQSPAWAYQVVSQQFDTDVSQLRYGQEFTATLMIRNLGHRTWQPDGPNPTRLGTERPQDRASGFADLEAGGWSSLTRASQIDGIVTNQVSASGGPVVAAAGPVKQGEIAYLTIPMRVPHGLNPGPYHEYFNLVTEGVTWLPDIGLYLPLQVVGP